MENRTIEPVIAYTRSGKQSITMSVYPDNVPIVVDVLSGVSALLVRPYTLTQFMAAMFLADAIHEREDNDIHLILPSIPGARQDRLNPSGDYLFTAKSIAKEINLRGFASVTVLDPHSDVAPSLIDRCNVIRTHELRMVMDTLRAQNYDGVIAPDAGAEKRAAGIAKVLGVPLFHAWKTRSVSDGKITGFGCEPLVGERLLVADDLCDGGGTFLGLREVIAEQTSAQCDLYVTHGLFSQGTSKLKKAFNRIYCTDSMPQAAAQSDVDVVHVCKVITKGILG